MKDRSKNPREMPHQRKLLAASRPPLKPDSPHRAVPMIHPTKPVLRPPPSKIILWFGLKLADRTLYYGSIGALLFGLVAACYLTLRRSSNLSSITWLPQALDPIIRWVDYHGRLRNVPTYALLAMPVMVLCRIRQSRAIAIALLAAFGAVLEGLQYFIPTRWCEWQDVALSWAGLLLTWGLAESLYWSAGGLHRFQTPYRHGRKHRSNARQSPLTEQEAQYQAELTRMQGEQEQMQAYLAQLQAEITRLHEVEFTLKTELAQTQQFSADADHFRHDKEISASQQALAQKQKELAAAQGQLEADQQKFATDMERFEEFAKQEAERAHLAQEIAQRDRQLAEKQKTLNDLLERHAAEQEKVEVERLEFLQEKSKLDKERATVQNASAVLEADKTALEAEMAKHTDAVKKFESKRAQFQEEMKLLFSAD